MGLVVSIIIGLVIARLITQYYKTYTINQICSIRNTILLPFDRSPEHLIIAFDLHGVIFRHNYKKMLKLFLESDKKWKLTWTCINPIIWFDVLCIARTCTVPEAFIMRLAQQHETIKELLPTIITIMNAQVPHEPTIHLINELNAQGYKLHIISNIGETIYRDLEKCFPEILSLFETIVVTSAATGYISKPNPTMYYTYLSTIPYTKKPIFIDDKIKNIESALNCGIASIYYQSFEHMHNELKKILNSYSTTI